MTVSEQNGGYFHSIRESPLRGGGQRCTRTSRRSRISPVEGDCVVELVGLEPTTKVLWNMVGVRPAPLVGHLSRSPGVLTVLLDFPGFLILEPTTKVLWNMAGVRPTTWSDTHPDRRAFVVFRDYPGSWLVFKESGSSATSPPRRTYSSLASVSAETTFYWACHFRFSLARKFPFLEIEKPIAETQEAEDEMLPSPFGGIPAAGRRVALPGARLEGIKLRINRAVP